MDSATPADVLVVRHVSKRFGTVTALQGVDVTCRAAEVHAVVGENGSGKSTLLGVASGVVEPDEGMVEIGGRRLHTGHVRDARHLGLAMAYQTYSHVADLTVAENVYLSVPDADRPPFHEMGSWARERLAEYDLDVDPGAPVAELPLAQRQLLEVVKALLQEPKVLLLDEPTTALGPGEVDRLHDLVVREASRGVGVLYVTHRLSEVFEIADRVTVLRDGVSQGTSETAGLTEHALVALMIGRPAELAFPAVGNGPGDGHDLVLAVEALRSDRFGPVDLRLRRGEIVGLAGAQGNGQDSFLRAVAGVEHGTGSVASVAGDGKPPRSPHQALDSGILFLSGDRLRETLFPTLGVRANSTVQVLDRFSGFGFVNRRREARAVAEMADDLQIRTPSVEQPVRFLSGGNQQKVALSRAFLRDPAVLLLEEPTQGVDIGSRFDIYTTLRERAEDGTGIVVLSSDPIELAGLCDRVLVMSRGRVVEELEGENLSEESIVAAIVQSKRARRGDGAEGAERTVGAEGEETASAVSPPAKPSRRLGWGWLPLAGIAVLALLLGGWTRSRSDAFLSEFNLNSLLLSTLPLALVAMGQVNALMVRGFDISVGALIALAVVVASFWLSTSSAELLFLGSLGVLGVGLAAGVLNVGLIVGARLPSIIATLATLSVMQGIALVLRPTPGGFIDGDLSRLLTESIGFVPVAFVGAVALAVAGDVWLYHSGSGLRTRAAGFDDTSAQRVGVNTRAVVIRAFVLTSLFTTVAAFFLAAQTGVGDARLAGDFALMSIAAAVLGGASLAGGRGSFTGAIVGAFFLTLLVNVLPFLGWTSAYGDIGTGAFILLALLAYTLAHGWAGRHRRGRTRVAG